MKALAKNLALFFISILVTLGMLEVVVRVLHLGSGSFWEPHELYGWRNIPEADGWESCLGECAVHIQINSKGLRDYEIPYDKADSQHRIFFLGDSMTAAMQVPLEQTFVKQLETLLQEETGTDWQAINGSVNAFGTDNQLLFYRFEGTKYAPDIVVLSMYLANDIYNNHRTLEMQFGGQEHKPYFTLDETNELVINNFPVEATETWIIRVGSFAKKHFQLTRFVAQTLKLRKNVPDWLRPIVTLIGGQRGAGTVEDETGDDNENTATAAPATICDQDYSPEILEAWNITKAIIRQLRTEVEAEDAHLVVLVVPALPQIIPPELDKEWYCQRPNQELTNFLEQEGIHYLDLLPAFQEHATVDGTPLYFERDFHLNQMGHNLTAERLASFMKDTLLELGY